MQYYWKVFLWENGTRSTEYTSHLAIPIFIEDRLDEELDTAQITLEAMPIVTKKSFPPKTKFRLERYSQSDFLDVPKKWDFVVDHDDVEEYAGVPDICCHRISLIEASVVAQGMHVDNIALTYELQDVDLNYRIPVDDETVIGDAISIPQRVEGGTTSGSPDETILRETSSVSGTLTGTRWVETGLFMNSYRFAWDSNSFNSIRALEAFRDGSGPHTITFTVPTLNCYVFNGTSFQLLFEVDTLTNVLEEKVNGSGVVVSTSTVLSVESGASSLPIVNNRYMYTETTSSGQRSGIRAIALDSEPYEYYPDSPVGSYTFPTEKYSGYVSIATSGHASKNVSFTTTPLTSQELLDGFEKRYTISFQPKPSANGGLVYYNCQYHYFVAQRNGFLLPWNYSGYTIDYGSRNTAAGALNGTVTPIRCLNTSVGAFVPYVKKAVKYSCYELIRKALLTCEARVINYTTHSLDEYGLTPDSGSSLVPVPSIDYPIVLDETATIGEYNLVDKLKATKINETTLEGKNLWEAFLQIGYYIHSIPYLEFYDNSTSPVDKLVLKFRQLGGTTTNVDNSTKITVFNSTSLSEYFAQYDSYATNLFSPQNICEEWVVCKTGDSSYLVSNDTAEIQLSYAITELIEFDIIYNGVSRSAIEYVFEKAIYDTLTGFDPRQVSPAKGNSLYFNLGDTKITGLSYTAQSVNPGDTMMALKYIMEKVHGVNPSVWTQTYTFNNLRFRVKYRTQDTVRVTQHRPDLTQYMKNSSLESYPHHEQFYGQQDKIIDSERFTANLWGKLIRVGNGVIERQEYSPIGSEKETGEIVKIDGENHYVVTTENEYYPDAVFQKVSYSKNFNQLSNIVTIPSEPRFYEVSERSKVRREIRLQDFFKLSVAAPSGYNVPKFMEETKWQAFIISLLFEKSRTLPNYAWTKFMADSFRKHEGATGGVIPNSQLFPSGDVTIRPVDGQVKVFPDAPSDHKACIVPLLQFPIRNGLVFEWDMADNFKVGDLVDNRLANPNTTADNAYLRQQALRYVDLMGRADLMQFMLFNKTDWTAEQIQQLPRAVLTPTLASTTVETTGVKAVCLDKDNREALSFNYQINLLYDTQQEGFITYPNLFGEKENNLKACGLNREQTIFDNQTRGTIIADNIPVSIYAAGTSVTIRILTPTFTTGYTIFDLASIVLYDDTTYGRIPYIARNVSNIPSSQKIDAWFITAVFNK